MLDPQMEMRASLLTRALDAGLAPEAALDQARSLWSFISGEPVPYPEDDQLLTGPIETDVIGIALHENGSWRRIDRHGRSLTFVETILHLHPVYAGIKEIGRDGQALASIPAFYVRTGRQGDERMWWVSAKPLPGFALHPAFRTPEGEARAAMLVGRYTAGRENGQLACRHGLEPWTGIDFDAAGAACRAIGEGWRMWSIYDLSAIQLLATIEMGSPDMQEMIGRGQVDGGGPVAAGASDASWRGIHELWGNVWQMVDGLRLSTDGVIEVWSTTHPGDGAWVSTGIGYGPGEDDGFPVSFHEERGSEFDLSLLFVPEEVTTDRRAAVIPDISIGHWGSRETVAYVGGGWSNASDAGVFALYLSSARSSAGSSIGVRPAFAL